MVTRAPPAAPIEIDPEERLRFSDARRETSAPDPTAPASIDSWSSEIVTACPRTVPLGSPGTNTDSPVRSTLRSTTEINR